MTAAVSKRQALVGALDWLGCYEGNKGPLLYRIEQADFDAEAEDIPADLVAAFYELTRQIIALDKKHSRNADVRYFKKRYDLDEATARAMLSRKW